MHAGCPSCNRSSLPATGTLTQKKNPSSMLSSYNKAAQTVNHSMVISGFKTLANTRSCTISPVSNLFGENWKYWSVCSRKITCFSKCSNHNLHTENTKPWHKHTGHNLLSNTHCYCTVNVISILISIMHDLAVFDVCTLLHHYTCKSHRSKLLLKWFHLWLLSNVNNVIMIGVIAIHVNMVVKHSQII